MIPVILYISIYQTKHRNSSRAVKWWINLVSREIKEKFHFRFARGKYFTLHLDGWEIYNCIFLTVVESHSFNDCRSYYKLKDQENSSEIKILNDFLIDCYSSWRVSSWGVVVENKRFENSGKVIFFPIYISFKRPLFKP